MRWFSYFECHDWYAGEVWFTKLLLSEGGAPDAIFNPESVLPASLEEGAMSHREELRQLKMKLGSWSLAPKLICPLSWWKNELLVGLGRPCWSDFALRAKNVKTAAQLQDHTAHKASSPALWANEVHKLLDNGFYAICQVLYPACIPDLGHGLEIHFGFLMRLVEKRLQSLSAHFLRPPYRYAACLVPELQAETFQKMDREFQMLLQAEEALAKGRLAFNDALGPNSLIPAP